MSEYDPRSEETIFSAALGCSSAERARYLDEACAGQPALRERIEGLLKAQLEVGEFLEEPAGLGTHGTPLMAAWTNPPEEGPGTRIGRYKLLQKIGEGGCGVVYMAEQEEPVRRRVALKVIKLGMDTREVIARFEAERQALALMDHPNIAKVLDGGATQTGRPYFVMELVRGSKITEFCDQNRLTTRERLDLFIQVCQAVQHAHQKGVIHRDLKPSNILVTLREPGGPAVPMVIDFGIAKATQGRLTDQTLFTAFEQFLGTPAYMSPEQAQMTALDIDTRSDIYSLGVLLYELLTGRTPFEGKELLAAGIEEMRRTIREKVPLRPSTRLSTLLAVEQTTAANLRRTEPPKLVHLVRGDLDWIVMKCLEKDRARRYETANALAMDLQRHLKNEPVVARPPSRLYEFQKTVSRHKAGFAATATVMIALAAGVVVSGRETARARRAELQTRYTGYVADMNLANRALAENDLGMAQAILRRYWPRSGEADLRNWEWRYLAKLSDGDPHVSLFAHSTWVRSLRFLDDETLLTAGSADWRTILWDLEKQQPSKIITNLSPAGGVSEHMAVAPRRMLMFYRAQWGGTPRMAVVDLRSGREEPYHEANRTRPDPNAPITSLDISRDQNSLCVAFGNRVALWDLDQATWSQPFETESGEAIRGLCSPDGRLLVVADESGQVAFWDLAERRKLGVVTTVTGSQGLLSFPVDRELSFSADGQWLVSPGGRWPAKVWRVEDRTLAAELHDSIATELAVFSPDGRWLAIAGGDASIRLWETRRWQKVRTLRGHADRVASMDFSPSGRYLASGARNGEVKLWSIAEPPTAPDHVAFPPSEYHRIASDGSGFGRILRLLDTNGVAAWTAEFWTSAPLQREFTVALPDGPPSSGVALGGGRGIVLGGFDGSIRMFNSPLGKERIVSNAHGGEVSLMAVSMDGSTLATKGLSDNGLPEERVRVRRLPGLELIAELPHAPHVHGIQLSDDGKLLAGFTGPGDMGVWEIPSMKGPPMWRGVEALQNVEVSAFSPGNRWLAAAPPDGSLYVWDLATRRRTVLPRALTSYLSLSFSPDGSRLAAGMAEEGKIFDTASGQEVLSFPAAGLLAFARDSKRLLAVRGVAASVFKAPPFAELQFDWLNALPSEEIPPYRGPDPDYVRPDRPPPDLQKP